VKRGHTVSTLSISLLSVLTCLAVMGCASTDASVTTESVVNKGANAVPPNFRKLVASQIVSTRDPKTIIDAKISQPGVGFIGTLYMGSNRPIVCARVTFQGPLIQQTYVAGYTFTNGQIEEVFYPGGYNPVSGALGAALQSAMSCDKLTYAAFPEIVKGKS
jgi:hypothetical protein